MQSLGETPAVPMHEEVRPNPSHKPSPPRLPSLVGRGLPERMRSTVVAFMGLTAAAGLALVAIFAQLGFPLLSPAPLPDHPAEESFVAESVPLEHGRGAIGLAESQGAVAAPVGSKRERRSASDEGTDDRAAVGTSPASVADPGLVGGPGGTDPAPASPPTPTPTPASPPVSTPTATPPEPSPAPAPAPAPATPSEPKPASSKPSKSKPKPAKSKPAKPEAKPTKPSKPAKPEAKAPKPKPTPATPADSKPGKPEAKPVPEPAPPPAPVPVEKTKDKEKDKEK